MFTFVSSHFAPFLGHLSRLNTVRNFVTYLLAHFVCRLVPSQCPFERTITLFGKPYRFQPCKLNPMYPLIMQLRFNCLCYLADTLGLDVSSYI